MLMNLVSIGANTFGVKGLRLLLLLLTNLKRMHVANRLEILKVNNMVLVITIGQFAIGYTIS